MRAYQEKDNKNLYLALCSLSDTLLSHQKQVELQRLFNLDN
jgi:hypothetical protein